MIGAPSIATPRTPTIKFRNEDVVHKYSPASAGADAEAFHERREASHLSVSPSLQPVREDRGESSSEQQRSQIALLPPLLDESESGGVRTAPSSTLYVGMMHSRIDPFEDAPATAMPSGFSSNSRSNQDRNNNASPNIHESPFSDPESPADNRLRSHFSAYSDDEHQSVWQQSTPASPTRSRQRGRGRSPNERGYPRTGGDDDKEESISLVQTEATDGSRESVVDESGDEEAPIGGIRLVGQTGRF